MSSKYLSVKCDACGALIERETLTFSIECQSRFFSGDLVDSQGREHQWDHPRVFGDLCSECAAPVVVALNDVLNSGQEDSNGSE